VAKSQCQEKSAHPETQADLKKVNVFFINASGFEKVNVFMCVCVDSASTTFGLCH
jgi:hypothetical protein